MTQRHLYPPSEVFLFFSIQHVRCTLSLQNCLDDIKKYTGVHCLSDSVFYSTQNPMNDYYAKQMGAEPASLERYFVTSEKTFPREALTECKRNLFALEELLTTNFRVLNIDPGYIALEHLVLASHKPFSHRVYLGHGVYSELELIYSGKNWNVLPWTYPDYNDHEKWDYFSKQRHRLLHALKNKD